MGIENPVLIPSITTERVVGCTGGIGDDEHMILFFRCQEGFLYRCGECDQVFMHVRVVYEHEKLWAARDPEVSDVFDFKLLEKGHKMWNEGEMAMWDVGYKAQDAVLGGRVLPGMQEYRDHLDEVAAGGKVHSRRINSAFLSRASRHFRKSKAPEKTSRALFLQCLTVSCPSKHLNQVKRHQST